MLNYLGYNIGKKKGRLIMKKFELITLDYNYDALEPYIDAATMEIHHTKHHQAYTNNFNIALEGLEDIVKDLSAEQIIAQVNEIIPQDNKQAIINNGGGYINHNLYFDILSLDNPEPTGELLNAINKKFGSFEELKKLLITAGTTQFGSGWAWLVVNNGELEVVKTANQDSPLTQGKTPILGIDVWEHAYYLNYQNKRPDYLENFFKVIDWKKVSERFEAAK